MNSINQYTRNRRHAYIFDDNFFVILNNYLQSIFNDNMYLETTQYIEDEDENELVQSPKSIIEI